MTPLGLKLRQVTDTVAFEWSRNRRKTLGLLVFTSVLPVLTYLTSWVQFNAGVSAPEDPVDFASNFFGFFTFFALVVGVAYGGPVVATDFERETGNLLFPKTSKSRLLAGRVAGNYALAAVQVAAYYAWVAAFVAATYDGEVPGALLTSFGWALLYVLAVFSFTTLFSSFMKSTAFTMVAVVLLLLLGFNIVQQLVVVFAGVEPLFSLPYYGEIIANSLDMPAERKQVIEIPFGPGGPGGGNGDSFSFVQWITPAPAGALAGMVAYVVVSLVLAHVLFKRRQGG